MKDSTYWYILQCAIQGNDAQAKNLSPKQFQMYEKLKKQIEQQRKKNPNAVFSACNSYDFELDF